MDFSVLMSVYKNDNPNHFMLALESVTTEQIKKPNQIVIVKDGPCNVGIDEAINLCQKKNEYIEFTVLQNDKNVGLAASLNYGLEYCKYEWIARMDADDISVPERFSKQCEAIYNDPSIDVLGGATCEFINIPGDSKSIRILGFTHEEICSSSKHRSPMNHPTVMYKKSKVKKVGKYDVTYGKLEDYKLWIDLINAGNRLMNIPDVLVFMRVGNGMISRRSNKREISDWDRLTMYMHSINLISYIDVMINKISIRVFTYMPPVAKRCIYRIIRR